MEQWACTTGDSSNLWHHGSEGTEADHSPLLSTLPTNSTCLSQRVTRVNMGMSM